jgi:transcriptional regulator with XRE-family HTH domain
MPFEPAPAPNDAEGGTVPSNLTATHDGRPRCHTRPMTASTGLGEFLRARRARLRPSDVGLPPGAGLRRTPGLRREELAALAGLSIDYYIRLEQGKETNPSTAILDGLARALHLTEEEHEHLYTLASHAARRTWPSSPHTVREVRAGVRLLLETVRPCPAYVQNRVNDILAANPEGLALFAGIEEWPAHRRNTVRYVFCHPAARTLFPDWEATALATVANLRARSLEAPDSPDLAAWWRRFRQIVPSSPACGGATTSGTGAARQRRSTIPGSVTSPSASRF